MHKSVSQVTNDSVHRMLTCGYTSVPQRSSYRPRACLENF